MDVCQVANDKALEESAMLLLICKALANLSLGPRSVIIVIFIFLFQ
jgi:hypothetical protein